VLEALARGKAVVATSVAAEGLDLRAGVDLEIADTPDQFAAACSGLLASRERRQAVGTAGRARVMERYRWTTIAPAVLSAAEASCAASAGNIAANRPTRVVAASSGEGVKSP
jgi:glycosyltransferase involved in cell wall biosynthesis